MNFKCMTIRELLEVINNIPEEYLDEKVMRADDEYGLSETYGATFHLRIDKTKECYFEIN